MRQTCLFCVSKHIAQAIILVTEARTGYPMHIWYAVGHLAEAEAESCRDFPEIANAIRGARLGLMGDGCAFSVESLDSLLMEVREHAEKINGISEVKRIQNILNQRHPEEIK